MSLIALIPAGGVGERAIDEQHRTPKQYRKIVGKSLLQHSVEALLSDPRVEGVHIGVAPADPLIEAEAAQLGTQVSIHRSGGESRAQTVLQTLLAIEETRGLSQEDWVLVHDAARPGLATAALTALIDTCLAQQCGGILALPVSDTVKRMLATEAKAADAIARIQETVPRDGLWLAQTPQLFKAIELKEALQRALTESAEITDEASAMEYVGQQPLLVRGHAENFKITWPQDFHLMAQYLTRDLE